MRVRKQKTVVTTRPSMEECALVHDNSVNAAVVGIVAGRVHVDVVISVVASQVPNQLVTVICYTEEQFPRR